MSENKTESKWEEEFKDFYWEQGKYKDRKLGIGEFINFISRIEKEAFEKGKEEERKAMYSDECLIIKKETRQETLEEVEKVIKEKASIKTEDKVVDIAILLFSEDILQQLNKMKEK